MASLSRIIPKRPLRTLNINTSWIPRRCNATLTEVAPDGPAITATNRAEATLKRFWTTVGIASTKEGNGTDMGGYHITLDSRPLRTPGGAKLVVPERKRVLAALVAKEWEDQETLIKPHALPMTSIVSRTIDAMYDEETKAGVRAALLKYLDTDTICFHQSEPEQLVRLQSEHWHPLIQWAKDEFGVEILIFDSILSVPQPAETVAKLDVILQGMSAWELAAMERATYATKSFIVALALVKRRINAEQAALAAQAEVDSQIERWGEVEDSHDVDHQDVRRQLGSAALVLSNC